MVDLHHHGDVEAGAGLLDFAVNVYPGPRPDWLEDGLRASLGEIDRYPDPTSARAALAAHYGRTPESVMPTAGAAEIFTLIARHEWFRPVVVHPQFTEPHAALLHAGHRVSEVVGCVEDDFALRPETVPEESDLVIVGNPTNPTGRVHPRDTILELMRPTRLVVVDEAFMDSTLTESDSLIPEAGPGLVVIRSLTKTWSIPGIRAGFAVGDPAALHAMADAQTPWSVSTPAAAAMIACASDAAAHEARRRAGEIADWRAHLEQQLTARNIAYVPSQTSFVLARAGVGVHDALRELGIAVRRGDTFPGLDDSWVRIACRPPEQTQQLMAAWDQLLRSPDDV